MKANSIKDTISLLKNLDKLLNDYFPNLLADCGNSLVAGLCSGWYKFLEIEVDDSQIITQTVKVPLNLFEESFNPVVRGFLCDYYVMDVAFAKPRRGNLNKSCFLP